MKLPLICRKATLTTTTTTNSGTPNDDGGGIGLPEQVLRTPCLFGVIAEFSAVNDLLSLASSSNAMHIAVTGLHHWKCGVEKHDGGMCKNRVFCAMGSLNDCLVPSCCQKCKTKLCSKCTVRCQSCHEIKCLDCDLEYCIPCKLWYCMDCKYGPPCRGCGTAYG